MEGVVAGSDNIDALEGMRVKKDCEKLKRNKVLKKIYAINQLI